MKSWKSPVKKSLDAGVAGVMFPFTSTPDLARQAAAAYRYPPSRRHGSGANLARFSWPEDDNFYDPADDNVTVIILIEEASAVERIDEIAATPGVAMLPSVLNSERAVQLRRPRKGPRRRALMVPAAPQADL
jgi:2-keto-3-deoxy-L-rhamnonate aldolase RhmA